MAKAVEHKGWAKIGQTVIEFYSGNPLRVTQDTVAKVTPTTVTLVSGTILRWNDRQGSYDIAGRTTWSFSTTILTMDDPSVPGLLRGQRMRNATARLRQLSAKFDPAQPDLAAAILMKDLALALVDLILEGQKK